jgi:hypothetical protein
VSNDDTELFNVFGVKVFGVVVPKSSKLLLDTNGLRLGVVVVFPILKTSLAASRDILGIVYLYKNRTKHKITTVAQNRSDFLTKP